MNKRKYGGVAVGRNGGRASRGHIAVIAGLMASWAAILPAAAENTTAMTPAEIQAALIAAGLAAEPFDDAGGGAPVIRAEAGELVFWTRGFECSGGACATLMMFANFELGRPVTASDMRVINRYNESRVYGRAYVLEAEQSIGVDYVIELAGGVSPDHVSGNVARWTDILNAFIENFREGPTSS